MTTSSMMDTPSSTLASLPLQNSWVALWFSAFNHRQHRRVLPGSPLPWFHLRTHRETVPPEGGDDRGVHGKALSLPQQGAVGLVRVRQVGQRLAHPRNGSETVPSQSEDLETEAAPGLDGWSAYFWFW